jgi:hypothetical protein
MIHFFDANHWLASSYYYLSSSLYSIGEKKGGVDNIKERLKDNDIEKVIITSKLAFGYDWNTGNKNLHKTNLSSYIDGLYYGYIINTDIYFTYEFDKYLKEAYKNKVRLFRLFPKRQLFFINDSYMKKVYKVLSERKFPIMLDLKQLDITGNKYFDIDVLEKILDENKGMPVILETSLKQCMFSRFYFPLLEKFDNLYLEVSGLLLYDQIEHYVEKFGSKRLIFGTNHPDLPIEVNTNRIILSDISDKDKRNIAFDNLNEIIGGIQIG